MVKSRLFNFQKILNLKFFGKDFFRNFSCIFLKPQKHHNLVNFCLKFFVHLLLEFSWKLGILAKTVYIFNKNKKIHRRKPVFDKNCHNSILEFAIVGHNNYMGSNTEKKPWTKLKCDNVWYCKVGRAITKWKKNRENSNIAIAILDKFTFLKESKNYFAFWWQQ